MKDGLERTACDEMARALAGCARGDAASWNTVLAEVRRAALDVARWKYRLDRDDAEDVAQVVQIRVAQRLCQLRDARAFPAWVRQLAHRASIDLLRSRRPLLSLDAPDAAWIDGCVSEEVESGFEQVLVRADLDRALERLPELYREPIRLFVLEGVPQDEVGRRLGRPRSTVASQIERGLSRLQRSLSPAVALH